MKRLIDKVAGFFNKLINYTSIKFAVTYWRFKDKPRYKYYLVHILYRWYSPILAYNTAKQAANPNNYRVNNRVPIKEIQSINTKGEIKLTAKSKYKLKDIQL